jgi:hypothetical protein
MRLLSLCSLTLLVFVRPVFAQEKPVVYVLKGQDRIEVRIDFLIQPEDFIRNYATDVNNYYLTEVRNADAVTKNVTAELEKIGKLVKLEDIKTALLDLNTKLKQPAPNLVDLNVPVVAKADGQHLELKLIRKLDYDQQYVLKIRGLDLSKKTQTVITGPPNLKPPQQPTGTNAEIPTATVGFTYPKDPTADIMPSRNVYDQKQIRVASSGPLQSPPSVIVVRKTLAISPDLTGLTTVPKNIDAKLDTFNDNALTFNLAKKLHGGTPNSLLIPSGITDGNKTVDARGAIKFPGSPAAPDVPKIDLGFSSVAAVHQKGVLELNLKATPTKPQPLGHHWFGEPKFEADVGLRSTKSANSIKVAYLFRRTLLAFDMNGRVEDDGITLKLPNGDRVKTTIPRFANWSTTRWWQPSSIKFFVGPKFETDRKFQRFNTLANARFDFGFHRWLGSIAERRSLLKDDLLTDADVKKENKNEHALVDLPFGLHIVPSLGFDIGGRLNDETVKNEKKKASVLVQRHNIFRIVPALSGAIEWRTGSLPTTLTLDESVTYLAAQEQVGLVTDTGVSLRKVQGFQPRFVSSIEFALDAARHYSFEIKYENGRSAPNFEYLNKVTTGIKVKFGSADQAPGTKF